MRISSNNKKKNRNLKKKTAPSIDSQNIKDSNPIFKFLFFSNRRKSTNLLMKRKRIRESKPCRIVKKKKMKMTDTMKI